MPTKAKLKIDDLELDIIFFDTDCAKAIVEALPIESSFNVWGDEFYFTIPVNMELDETATTDVEVGDIGYWPVGSALAIFFGPTPMSTSEKPVPASEVNLVGKI
ncbi:MAG: hypothetical protein D6828_03200, partial [Nitrospirae bacterium]